MYYHKNKKTRVSQKLINIGPGWDLALGKFENVALASKKVALVALKACTKVSDVYKENGVNTKLANEEN